MATSDETRRRALGRGESTVPRAQPHGVRAVVPEPRAEQTGPGPDDSVAEGPRTPDERSGVRILRPDDRSDEPRRQVRQGPPLPTGEPETVIVDYEEEVEEPPAHSTTRDRVLGVNFAGDVAHLAIIEPPDHAVLDIADQLAPTGDTDDSERLAGFAERAGRIMRDLGVAVVAVARPLRYTNWTYANAFERVSLETCLMLEAHRLSIRFESVGQHHAANVIGLPAKQLADSLPTRLRIPKSTDWPNRYPALLVALAVALEM